MPDWLRHYVPDTWSDRDILIGGVAITVVTFVLSLIISFIVVIRIPHDYFVGDHPPKMWGDRHPFIRLPAVLLKNLFGAFLVVLGLVMSVPGVPGQGILTILMGAMLLDFPGKRRCEKWLLRRRGVLKTINKWRTRRGRLPLQIDAPTA
jgi:hypothetical protein